MKGFVYARRGSAVTVWAFCYRTFLVMERVEKTVFLSYRRTNLPWALNIYQNLTFHGFDVFFDYTGISSGDFESVILGNVPGRHTSLSCLRRQHWSVATIPKI